MTACLICEQIQKKKNLLVESSQAVALLSDTPAAEGHVMVVPKQHSPIAEQVSDTVMGEMFTLANKISIQLFERFGALGTNILLQNGLAAGQSVNHVVLHVIPRFEKDGLNLEWQPKQITDAEMSQIELVMRDEIKQISAEKPQEKEKQAEQKKDEQKKEGVPAEEDYLLKQLRRIP